MEQENQRFKTFNRNLKPNCRGYLFEGRQWKRSVLKDIGSLIESPPLYDNLTAYENAKVHAALLGLPDARITEVLKLLICIIPERKGGQFLWDEAEAGIAIALLNRPKLLILDEPTNGLDPIGIQELRELIRSFPEQGMTVIYQATFIGSRADRRPYRDYQRRVSRISGEINKGDDLERLLWMLSNQRGRKRAEKSDRILCKAET
ncbi:lantibiotic ABC transporter ATP-binding protein [Bacillus licheniformis]|nr:lantibiotic ABC transporter ATP-binding protein [Bacillus licheniformis]